MDYDLFNMYVLGMNQIEHEELLVKYTVADYPNMTTDNRSKLHRETSKAAYPKAFNEQKNVVSFKDLGKVLK